MSRFFQQLTTQNAEWLWLIIGLAAIPFVLYAFWPMKKR